MDMGSHHGHSHDQEHFNNLSFFHLMEAASIGPVVSEKMFENGRRRRRTKEACLCYKLTHEPKGSGDLIIIIITLFKEDNIFGANPSLSYTVQIVLRN